MHHLFSAPVSAAHPEILNRSAKTGDNMTFSMGHDNHAGGVSNITTNFNRLKMGTIYRHIDKVFAKKSVSDDYRSINRSIGKAVLNGSLKVIDAVGAGTNVERVSIG